MQDPGFHSLPVSASFHGSTVTGQEIRVRIGGVSRPPQLFIKCQIEALVTKCWIEAKWTLISLASAG